MEYYFLLLFNYGFTYLCFLSTVMDKYSRYDRFQNKKYYMETGNYESNFHHHNARAVAGSGKVYPLFLL